MNEPVPNPTVHEPMMRLALADAEAAAAAGDVGVAAIVVRDGEVVGRGRNRIVTRRDPLAHAETEAIVDAYGRVGRDLAQCTIYTTMEPCPMCAGAIQLAGLRRVVLGGRHASLGRTDLGRYSIESFAEFVGGEIDLTQGVLQAECEAIRRRWTGPLLP